MSFVCASPGGGCAPAALLDALPSAVLVVGAGGTIEWSNRRAVEVLGLRPESLDGTALGAILPQVAGYLLEHPATGTAAAGTAEAEERHRATHLRPDGSRVELGWRAAPFSLPGGEPATGLVFQDLTALEALREERDRLLQLAAVGEVLPAILHELKNPLAAVTTAVEVLLEEVPEGPVQSELHAILGEVRRMKLGFEGIGLLNHGLRRTRYQAVDLALVEAFRVLQPQFVAKGVEARCEVPSLPLLPFDAGSVRAILFNLLTNALHASSRGGVVTVRAELARGGRAFRLAVADTGSGMSAEVLARCRELFYTTKSNGSGVGLALCDSVVAHDGGELSIESAPGRGTTVTVALPLAETGASDSSGYFRRIPAPAAGTPEEA
jgi:signal transduction histidine kinase